MKLAVFLLSLVLAVAVDSVPVQLGDIYPSPYWGAPWIWTKRSTADDAAPTVNGDADSQSGASAVGGDESGDQPGVYDQIESLLQSVSTGVSLEDLGETASNIQDAAEAMIEASGEIAEEADIQALIKEAAESFEVDIAVSSLFDDPLTNEDHKMNAALHILGSLAEKAKQAEENGESSTTALAAITRTTKAVQRTVLGTATMIFVSSKLAEQQENVEELLQLEGLDLQMSADNRLTKRQGCTCDGGNDSDNNSSDNNDDDDETYHV